jgi:hypothetical protein
MSDKQFEECTLEDATHIEVNGKVYWLENDKIALEYYHDKCIGIRWWDTDTFIPEELFSTLGIKPLREIKPEPIEFEAVFVKHDGEWRHLLTIDDGISIQNCKIARFRCVEILEEKK